MQLSEIAGRRLNRSGGESTDSFYRMVVVCPERARELLHRLVTFRAGILDMDNTDNHPFAARANNNRMPLAQYECVVEAQEGNGHCIVFGKIRWKIVLVKERMPILWNSPWNCSRRTSGTSC